MPKSVPTFHTPGLRGKNLQATQCVLGGKSRVKVVTLFLTPPFRPTPNKAKGGRPYLVAKAVKAWCYGDDLVV